MIYTTRIHENPPASGTGIRLAIYQGQQPVGTPKAIAENIDALEKVAGKAKKFGADIISFPELYIEGYTLTPDIAHKLAESFDGPSMRHVASIAKEKKIGIVCPYAEKEEQGSRIFYYDSIAVFDTNGELVINYRKTHLFGQAERDNWDFGSVDSKENPFLVREVAGFPIAVLNCYEAEFFELSRILALQGAKLIIIPTAADFYYTLPNGKKTSVAYPDISKNLIPAHAYENNCFISYCNRAGTETVNGETWRYRGNSIIVGPHGDIIIAARNEPTLLIADCIPTEYSRTHPEGDYLKDRRPELYKKLTDMKGEFDGGYVYKKPSK
ncbi:MAG: carbon-nitrogen hydrolase family protein [bacterium]|nr:carbon-nitrogen hydrolase family protein [bacterium]